jgi:hypothetical protein
MGSVENDLTNAALQYLTMRGVYCWRNNSGAYKPEGSTRYIRYGYPGSSDILGVTMDGRMVACEVKGQFGTLSSHQKAFLEEVASRGGVGVVIRANQDWQGALDTALSEVKA